MIVTTHVVRVVRQHMRSVWTGRRFLPMADLGVGAASLLSGNRLGGRELGMWSCVEGGRANGSAESIFPREGR